MKFPSCAVVLTIWVIFVHLPNSSSSIPSDIIKEKLGDLLTEDQLQKFTETYNAGHPLKAVKTLKQQLKKEKIPKKEFNKLWKTVKKLRESDEILTKLFKRALNRAKRYLPKKVIKQIFAMKKAREAEFYTTFPVFMSAVAQSAAKMDPSKSSEIKEVFDSPLQHFDTAKKRERLLNAIEYFS